MSFGRTLRTTSTALGGLALAALISLSASPAAAADAPWTPPVEVVDSYGDPNATVVAPDGTITTVAESALGVITASSANGGATWGPSTILSETDYAYRPAVAVTSTGLLAATWVQSVSDVRSIQVSVSSDGGGTWGTPVSLPTVTGDLDDPVIASTGASAFLVVWNEGFVKRSSVSTDGGATWSPSEIVTQDMNSYGRASLAPLGGNEISVVFQEFDGDSARYSIKSRLSTDGGATWGSTVLVGSDWPGAFGNGIYQYGVSPAEGTLVAVWSRGTADGDALFASTSTDGGATWSTDFSVGSPADQLRNFTVTAISATSVGVLWFDTAVEGMTLRYSTVAVGASSAPTPVTIAVSPDFAFDRLPSFAALGDVRVASWFEYLSEEEAAMYTSVSCDAGATWSDPLELASGDDVTEVNPQVVVSGGSFVAYWGQEATGPTGRSLFTSTLTNPCGAVPPGPALAATGAPIAPAALTALTALTALLLGAGVLAVRRRSEAS